MADPFREIWRPHRYKVFYGGRGCVDGDTKLSTPSGEVQIKDFKGGLVYAFDGDIVRPVFATAPKKFEAENLYRVSTASSSIVVTANHRFLTDCGWIRACDLQTGRDHLAVVPKRTDESAFDLRSSISDSNPSGFQTGAENCFRTVLGFLSCCLPDFRPDGERPRWVSGSDLSVVPSQDGAQQRNSRVSFRRDDQAFAYIGDLCNQLLCHLESRGAPLGEEGKSSVGLGICNVDKFFELFSALRQVSEQSRGYRDPVGTVHRFAELVQAFCNHEDLDESWRKAFESGLFASHDNPYSDSISCNRNHHRILALEAVESVDFIAKKEFFDIFVPCFNNYIANGFVNHNSGKSWAVAQALMVMCDMANIRILCCREIQNSIKDSSYQILRDTAERLGISGRFSFLESEIRHKLTGSRFIFKGLLRNEQSVKSTEGIDICWVEEAQTVSESSWEVLIPTVRKQGSEIWVTFNPLNADDPTTKRFIENPPPEAYVRKINFDENPHFPPELRAEMEHDKAVDFEKYLHIWEGFPRTVSDAQVFKGRYSVESFPDDLWKKADRLFFGADFGFARDPSTLIRCFMYDGKLYIDYEAYAVGVEIDELPAFYRTVPEVDNWPIHADAARPETISYLANRANPPFRISAASKWQGSIEDGVAYLKSFEKIIVHPRCKHTADEFRLYSYKVDKTTGEVLSVFVDKNNHAIDGIRYALDGYITKPGLSKWARLAQ